MKENLADASDQVQLLVAVALALGSVLFGLMAASHVLTESTIAMLRPLYIVVGVITVGLTFTWLWKLRAFKHLRIVEIINPVFASGFVGEAMRKAYAMSWTITVLGLAFILIGGFQPFVDSLPASFLIHAILAEMSMVYSATFFYYYFNVVGDNNDE